MNTTKIKIGSSEETQRVLEVDMQAFLFFLSFKLTCSGGRMFRSAEAEVPGNDLSASMTSGHASSASASTHLLCLRDHSRLL
jgi:hypothetical protein